MNVERAVGEQRGNHLAHATVEIARVRVPC